MTKAEIRRAASFLRRYGQELHRSETVNGVWVDAKDVKQEHDEIKGLVVKLNKMAKEQVNREVDHG